jgi:hypothetical protein
LTYATRLLLALVFVGALSFGSGAVVLGADAAPPAPITGPRLKPPPIPHPYVAPSELIAAQRQSLPAPAQEAADLAGPLAAESPGRGVAQAATTVGSGLTLFPDEAVCNNFNRRSAWSVPKTGIWTAWYGDWTPFAVDDGGYYRAANVVFAHERSIGPGRYYAANQYSAKIASYQPYAAGYSSPLIEVRPGATITVSVKYLIWDHDTPGQEADWASLGIKPDGLGSPATYVNGYVRGKWAELIHTVTTGPSGQVLIYLQASSPVAVNSNIYFDDVKIRVNNRNLNRCF